MERGSPAKVQRVPTTKVSIRVWGVVGAGLRAYGSHANTLLLLVAVVLVPTYILLALLVSAGLPDELLEQSYWAGPRFERTETTGRVGEEIDLDRESLADAIAVGTIGLVVAFVGTTLATGVAFTAIADAHRGRDPTWRSSLTTAMSRWGSLLWLGILIPALLVVAFLALVLPAIYLWVAWAVAIPVLLDEDRRGLKALGRSRRLVKGNWWPTLGIMLIGGIVGAVISWLVGVVVRIGQSSPTVADGLAVEAASSLITQILTTPLLAALAAILYFELRKLEAEPGPQESASIT